MQTLVDLCYLPSRIILDFFQKAVSRSRQDNSSQLVEVD